MHQWAPRLKVIPKPKGPKPLVNESHSVCRLPLGQRSTVHVMH